MRCILLVEDDATIRKVMELACSQACAGCTVLAATTGQEFLELLRTRQPALILLDVQLPDTSGIALYRIVRQYDHLAQVPALFVTVNPALVWQAALAGTYQCLPKPFAVEDLIHSIQALLGSTQAA